MADIFSQAKRRQIMRAVRREGTEPEMACERRFSDAGLHFQRNSSDVLGRPDFYFADARTVVFVHGCFWHGHRKCSKGTNRSKSNAKYWDDKIAKNRRRDDRITRRLRLTGLSVFTLWECQIRKKGVPRRLLNHLFRAGVQTRPASQSAAALS